jgi:hypothetical protein
MKSLKLLALGAVLLLFVSCTAQKTLTREKARTLLEAKDDCRKPKIVTLSQSLQEDGRKYWDIIGLMGSHPPGRCATPEMYTACLTGVGLSFFSEIAGEGGLAGPQKVRVVPKFDLPRTITSIDGISDAPAYEYAGAKMVDYQWKYDISRLEFPMQALFQGRRGEFPMHGQAIFRLYDDGWRVAECKD